MCFVQAPVSLQKVHSAEDDDVLAEANPTVKEYIRIKYFYPLSGIIKLYVIMLYTIKNDCWGL